MYRIKINNIGYVKSVEFNVDSSLLVVPTTMPNEAELFGKDQAKRYCNILNYENQSKNITFSIEEIPSE